MITAKARSLWGTKGFALLLLVCASTVVTLAGGEKLPDMTQRVPIHEQELQIDAGQTWSKRIVVPKLGADECPVLALRARVQIPSRGGGCNYVLQVLIDGVPLTETPMHPRLINKAPTFDPPNTQYHFNWYGAEHQGWMTIFSCTFDTNWGGTGRDCEFVFDLSGIVTSGAGSNLAFRYLNPYIPKALKLDRAPLTLDNVVLGAMKRAEVEKLRLEAQKGLALREIAAEAKLPAGAKPGERPYEIVWSGKKESPPAQVAFDDLTGWTMTVLGDAKVSLAASMDYLLWRRQLAKFSYADGTRDTVVEIRPSKPILIPEHFDAANLWMYGALKRQEDRPLRIFALLEDQAGRDFSIDLGPVTSTYWGVQHGVLDAKATSNARFPMKFKALMVSTYKVKGERNAYLESLAFCQQNRKPVTRITRPDPTAFPTSDDGMLPTPPFDCRITIRPSQNATEFITQTSAGVLRYTVTPRDGCLHGVTARWNDGPVFRPMDGGHVSPDFGDGAIKLVPDTAKVISSQMKDGCLLARWRFEQDGKSLEWEATYSIRGRTLIVDVKCTGGAATGLVLGDVAGLPTPRGIEVPYLMYGQKPGPWIGCAGDLFVSVLPDLYHSDFSSIDSSVRPAQGDRIGLVTRTSYQALTNGRRNDLRDRILITVSPEFAETLPNARNPVSPNRERLAPYMFFMASYLTPDFWRILKRHGIDCVIANDFARIFVKEYPEGFAARWRPHPMLTIQQVQEYRSGIKSLGYLYGMYIDVRDVFPGNEYWSDNIASLTPSGDWVDAWYGTHLPKPIVMPQLVRAVGQKVKELYPAECVYMDTHTNIGPSAMDYEAGVEGAGMARPQVTANGDCIVEARKWYGSTMSEGIYRWLYAGLCDMDYATLISSTTPPADLPPLVDFDLLKIHPFEHGTMMSYSPSAFVSKEELSTLYGDKGQGTAPLAYYKYVSASLAYGHMLILGYGYIPPLSRFIQYHATMQGVQREYLTDNATEISYHNGREFLPTSRALVADSQKSGRVRVRYSRGLTVHVNYNPSEPWKVAAEGRTYELPPYGWLIVKPGEILSYSALVNARRVDYVRCPDYIYLNSGDGRVTEGPLEVQGAVWLKREAERGALRASPAWRLIPCGDLGKWESAPTPGLPAFMRDTRLSGTPPDRGCRYMALDTNVLLGKESARTKVTAHAESGNAIEPNVRRVDPAHIEIAPSEGAVDYLLE